MFAEVFNEMLMRDFGFTIYKEVYLYKENKNVDNIVETEKTNTNGAASTADKSSDKKEEKTNEAAAAAQPAKIEARKRRQSIAAPPPVAETTSEASADKKMVIVKPQLLLSFIYFDTTQCGYIFQNDLENLFAIIGLNLSRSQIKKVLAKLTTRHAVYYR